MEKRTLRDADALVTVSQPWADRLQSRYPGKKVFAIANGFDPDDYRSPAPALTREFSITYTGELYQGQRDPTQLFEVLSDLLREGSVLLEDLRVRFYGAVEPWLPILVEKFGLQQVVELHGSTPRGSRFLSTSANHNCSWLSPGATPARPVTTPPSCLSTWRRNGRCWRWAGPAVC